MEEQNNQNLDNQESEATKAVDASEVKVKKPLSKKAKIGIIVGAAVLVVVVTLILLWVFGVFACNHSWDTIVIKEAICNELGLEKSTCTKCGEVLTYETVGFHDYTCIEESGSCLTGIEYRNKCSVCGDEYTWVGAGYESHQFSDYWTETYTDCLEEGVRERHCYLCSEKETETIPARGEHTFYSSESVIIKEATCTEEGTKESVCHYCDEKKTEIIPYAHEYVSGICSKCNRGLINIILPDTPITVHDFNYNGIDETCKITSIELKSVTKKYDGTYDLIFIWAGKKTYDDDGNNHSSSVGFGYKLYDSDGYVVKSGDASSVGVCVGEKFRDQELIWYYADLDPNETYTLEILNLD